MWLEAMGEMRRGERWDIKGDRGLWRRLEPFDGDEMDG